MGFADDDVRTLQKKTGADTKDCEEALKATNGDLKQAEELLQKMGLAAKPGPNEEKESRMTTITADEVKALREKTGAGMMDCKKALQETDGNFENAVKWLREKGIASAAKRAGRTASEGAVTSYIHMGGKIGVLVEVNCETDFVARNDTFQEFCKNVCLQICSAAPRWVRREDVPESVTDEEKRIFKQQMADSGKPENVLEKIAEGKLNKFFEENVLLEQPYVKEPKTTIEALMKELSGTVGEKIDIRRFTRYELGEEIEYGAGSGDGAES